MLSFQYDWVYLVPLSCHPKPVESLIPSTQRYTHPSKVLLYAIKLIVSVVRQTNTCMEPYCLAYLSAVFSEPKLAMQFACRRCHPVIRNASKCLGLRVLSYCLDTVQ